MTSSQTPPVESASENNWWVAKSGKHHGPFSKAKIAAEIRVGKTNPTTLICVVGGETCLSVTAVSMLQKRRSH